MHNMKNCQVKQTTDQTMVSTTV